MSTFDGFIKEFPDITVDHFTLKPNRPPRAAFLSHVHKDHMVGLETYASSFVYCSGATKQLVSKLQTKRDRLDFADGTIEKKIYSYSSLLYNKKLLKPLPFNTPTRIPVGDSTITVTLIEANHCPGSTMFLFERDSVSVLYTGDIRAEHWWLQSLSRLPFLGPYMSGLRQLDCLYLDTTFASVNECTREFPDRATSIQELLKMMHKYPRNTVFHFNCWTFGYEDLWVAIANSFRCKIHVDRYRCELYRSIKSPDVWEWGPFLGGHVDPGQKKDGLADHVYEGQLTEDPNTILHSCESRGVCPVRDAANVVQIIPITSDKAPKKEYLTESGVIESANRQEQSKKRKASDDISDRPGKMASNAILNEPGHTLLEPRENWWVRHGTKERPPIYSSDGDILPYYLTVALSRHSSLNELRGVVGLFKPRDLFPCVEDPQKLTYLDLEACFGDLCDLSDCTYLKRIRNEGKPRADILSTEMLVGKLLDDALSDDDNDEGLETQTFGSQENWIAIAMKQESTNGNCSPKSCLNMPSGAVVAPDGTLAPTEPDIEPEPILGNGLELPEPIESKPNCSQDDIFSTKLLQDEDILVDDDYKADLDRIRDIVDVILKGGEVELQSVKAALG